MTHPQAPKEGTVVQHDKSAKDGELWEKRVKADDTEDDATSPNITGGCGTGSRGAKKRKAVTPITRNRGNIDPVDPHCADAVMAGKSWIQSRWKFESICGPAKRQVLLGRPSENPNSGDNGHTCPGSGEE